MEGFGERLKQAIVNTGKSRRRFAIEIGIDDGLLSSYVHEKSYPNSYMAVRLAKALGVSLDWLLLGEEK